MSVEKYDDGHGVHGEFGESSTGAHQPNTVKNEAILKKLRSIPMKEDGLNLQRVEKFLDEQQLHRCEYFAIHSSEIPEELSWLKAKMKMKPTAFGVNGGAVVGVYVYALDVVIVFRDVMEKNNNPHVVQEAILVHELAHSSGYKDGFVRPKESQKGKTRDGIFFEEAFCNVIESDYFAQHGSMKDTGTKDAPHNPTLHSVIFIRNPNNQDLSEGDVVYLDTKRNWSAAHAGIAGFGLELLCRAIPSLKNILIKARSDPASFSKALSLIDKHFPGLSKKLMELQEEKEDFAKGNALILEAIYGKNTVKVNSRAEPIVPNVTSFRYRIGGLLGFK